MSHRMLSIIPADSVLVVAIKDAKVSTSSVNPARITTAVQKMRPDWSVNKRRVKRLLRSMNNDAWKAAVSPTFNASSLARDEPAGSRSSRAVSDGSAPAGSSEKKGSARGKHVSKKAALAAASKSGASAVFPEEEGKEGNGAGCSSGGDVCETAPASPGSPTGGAAVCSSSSAAVCSAVTGVVVNSRTTVESLRLNGATGDAADAAPVLREGALAKGDREADGGAAEGGEDDALVDSLRLEPDFELEAASVECLKAHLGLPTATDECDDYDDAAADVLLDCTEGEGVNVGGGGGGDDAGASGRADDLGFEMIDRAEALAAPAAAGDAAQPFGSAGSKGIRGRKGWSWSWSRS